MRKTTSYLLGSLVCLMILALLPIIPIQSSAIIPISDYSLSFQSISELVIPTRVGVSYRIEWYTIVSIVVLLSVGVLVGILVTHALQKIILKLRAKSG
jgi:hydrogenase-4 membrane subunit HyfE